VKSESDMVCETAPIQLGLLHVMFLEKGIQVK